MYQTDGLELECISLQMKLIKFNHNARCTMFRASGSCKWLKLVKSMYAINAIVAKYCKLYNFAFAFSI